MSPHEDTGLIKRYLDIIDKHTALPQC